MATAWVPVQLPLGCGICEPQVVVSPDAGKALIAVIGGRSVVNLATGYSQTFDRGETEVDQLFDDRSFDALPAMVWLDPDRLFAYATTKGVGWILTGDQLNMIEKKFALPSVEGAVMRTVLREDGTVVLLTEHGLVLVNPDTGEAEVTGLNAEAVTADGGLRGPLHHRERAGERNDRGDHRRGIASGRQEGARRGCTGVLR